LTPARSWVGLSVRIQVRSVSRDGEERLIMSSCRGIVSAG
jgi:hypothetical protein